MVIIPFFISGNVTVDGKKIQLDQYYHIYGNCQLTIESEPDLEGKLGVWAYKLGK